MRRFLITLLGFWVVLAASACSSDDISAFKGKGKKKKVTSEEGDDPNVDEDKENANKYTKTIDNSGANFQVKDLALLRSSIDSCMGPDMLKISSEMLLPADLSAAQTPLPDAKLRFLLPTQYADGDDILDKEKGNLVDAAAAGARTSIAADSLTDTYLRSLETVANVVAHNCAADREQCKCESKEASRAMLTRCLPGLDPETKEMDEAAEMLGLVCVTGAEGMRKAIASMLSSYAFASSR